MSSFSKRIQAAGVSVSLAILLTTIVACGSKAADPSNSGAEVSRSRLVYEFVVPDGQEVSHEDIEKAISRRLKPLGSSSKVKVVDDNQVEIVIGARRAADVAAAKRALAAKGGFELRIVVDSLQHEDIVEQATNEENAGKQIVRGTLEADRLVGRPMHGPIAKWVKVRRAATKNGEAKLMVSVRGDVIRDAKMKKLIGKPPKDLESTDEAFEEWLAEQGVSDVEVLVLLADGYDITSDSVADVNVSWDERGMPSVAFQMTEEGGIGLRGLTSEHQPSEDRTYRLGIVVQDVLMTAPRLMGVISDRGQITGNFTKDEVESMAAVMRTNSLPVLLDQEPIEESVIEQRLN